MTKPEPNVEEDPLRLIDQVSVTSKVMDFDKNFSTSCQKTNVNIELQMMMNDI